MKTIRIFRHVDCEGPAYLQTCLESGRIPFELIRIDAGDNIDADLRNIAGLIFMGGNMSVNDPLDWIDEELAIIRTAMRQNIPVLGVCLGSQLMARALGSRVYPGPCMEIGWYPVECVGENAICDGLPGQLNVFHWHGETFDLPPSAQRIFSNSRYENQGFSLGPHLGLQFHLEMQASQVHEWIERNPADLLRRCEQHHDAAAILTDLDRRIRTLQSLADTLFKNWLSNCQLD